MELIYSLKMMDLFIMLVAGDSIVRRPCMCESTNHATSSFTYMTRLGVFTFTRWRPVLFFRLHMTSGHCRRWRSRMEVKIMAGSLFVHCKIAYFYSLTVEKWLIVSLPNIVTIRRTHFSNHVKFSAEFARWNLRYTPWNFAILQRIL